MSKQNDDDIIHPMFDDLHLDFEETVENNLDYLPPTHPVFNDIWRQIEQYSDKKYLYEIFKEEENKEKGIFKTYDNLIKLRDLDDEHDFLDKVSTKFNIKYQQYIGTGAMTMDEAKEQFMSYDFFELFSNILTENDDEIIYCFEGNPNLTRKDLDAKIATLKPKVDGLKEHSFAEEIKKRYLDGNHTYIPLKLDIDVRNIIRNKKRIESNYDNIIVNDQPPIFYIHVKGPRKEDKIKIEVCKILEKRLNLVKNPRDDMYYISDGQGKYIPFDESTSKYTYVPLREKFVLKYSNKEGEQEEELIWSKNAFFKIAEQYGVQESEVECDVVGFKNCYLNLKERKIYKLDYRFPHLAIKDLSTSFIYSHEMNGGALEVILNECFTDQDRDILFQYFGRALFEQGYKQSQDVVFFLGAGEMGKTTFINSLAQIFKNVSLIEANKFDVDNQFAFAEIPGSDFVIIDEIQSMKNKGKFTEKIKQFTGGSATIPIERKNKNVFQLPAEYIPRIIGIGNELPDTVYEKFAGKGVIRRFCIIFAKRSILKAKRMTKVIDGVEYPITQNGYILGLNEMEREYDEDGELHGLLYDDNFNMLDDNYQIISEDDTEASQGQGIQGRTKFKQEELTADGCLEWFVQQIILNYREDGGSLLPTEQAKERATMANNPELWSIYRNYEAVYDDYGLDMDCFVYADDLIDYIRKDIDDHLLEHTILTKHSDKIVDNIRRALHIKEEVIFEDYEDNKKIFKGIRQLVTPKPFSFDDIEPK